MASALELMVQNFAPMLQKMIPPTVWEAVVDNVKRMADKVASIDARLERLEIGQREILVHVRTGALLTDVLDRMETPNDAAKLVKDAADDTIRRINLEAHNATAQIGHNGTGNPTPERHE